MLEPFHIVKHEYIGPEYQDRLLHWIIILLEKLGYKKLLLMAILNCLWYIFIALSIAMYVPVD